MRFTPGVEAVRDSVAFAFYNGGAAGSEGVVVYGDNVSADFERVNHAVGVTIASAMKEDYAVRVVKGL